MDAVRFGQRRLYVVARPQAVGCGSVARDAAMDTADAIDAALGSGAGCGSKPRGHDVKLADIP